MDNNMSEKNMSNKIAQRGRAKNNRNAGLDEISKVPGERGSSLIITLLVMFLLLGFVALTLSRTVSETAVSTNDQSEAKAFEAAQAGLEDATRDFASVMETKLSPTTADIYRIKNSDVYGFTDTFSISKDPQQISNSKVVTIDEGPFQGLIKIQDEWQIKVTAKEKNSDVQVDLMRRFYNNRIPLFQFGAFYNDDLELNRPPLFTFGGRVHTNSNFFVTGYSPNAGIYFNEKVTAAGEIVNDIWKTGTTLNTSTDGAGQVFFRNASLNSVELKTGEGSVNCISSTGGGVLKSIGGRGRAFPYPTCQNNSNWSSIAARFDGNLTAHSKELRLPVDQLTNADGSKVDLIEMMRRGKNLKDKISNGTSSPVDVTTATVDDPVLSKERYANKPGIRISLADSQNELPQCAVATTCGVQLDANYTKNGTTSLGYQPVPMVDGSTYQTTAVNGNRLSANGRQTWIKVELVSYDNDNYLPLTTDITQDFLSLGMTEPIDTNGMTLYPYQIASGTTPQQDSRSIIKIQQFYIDGNFLPVDNNYLTNKTINGINYNFVARKNIAVPATSSLLPICINGLKLPIENLTSCGTETSKNGYAAPVTDAGPTVFGGNSTEDAHYKVLIPADNSAIYRVVPFPIQMYDSREGNRQDSNTGISGNNVFRNGVMSLIDIDVKNLKRFFDGEFDGKFPTNTPFAISNSNIGLKSTNVPESRGWVLFFSDRRGDNDFDGRYDMEQVSPFSTASLVDQDLNNNGLIDVDFSTAASSSGYNGESSALDKQISPEWAAVTDHAYYRRGIRLINGKQIPGKYDKDSPTTTQGFTVASENGIYVAGNYNVDSVTLSGTNAPAPAANYFPQGSSSLLQIPASIVGDSITVLSNNWNDSASFTRAFDSTQRVASNTQLRFAMISGDSLTARTILTNGNFDGLNGGLHNFLRFLETWNGRRLNYTGSLINLFNSFNNNGRWKCCTTVYSPPIRDWTFDDSFKDPNRLPPGSPFVYSLTLTGFQRINE